MDCQISSKTYNEADILEQLDLAFNGIPSKYYPHMRQGDIAYNFFLDLEHGYCETAGSKIHLYADELDWVVVFEKSGYNNRGTSAGIELNYIGTCIDYPIDSYPEQNYITNTSRISLIEPQEFERIENRVGEEMKTFELIGADVKSIKVRDIFIDFDGDYRTYEKKGIAVRGDDNPKKLIGFGDLIRYLNTTNQELVSAQEVEILKHIDKELPKIMTLNKFHFISGYDKSNPPSSQETYKLIARVLMSKDSNIWQPTKEPNNHWSSWESGNL